MQLSHYLNHLQTFVVVAEQLNFSRASDLLHLTPSAVSHQMKQLEMYLDIKLFFRKSKGVALTKEAQELYQQVKLGLTTIQSGIVKAQQYQRKKLTIAAIPSVVSCLLVNKLDELKRLFPDYEISLVSQHQVVDFSSQDIDCHIHFGSGELSGLIAQKIANETIYPVCHSELFTQSETLPLIEYSPGFEDKPGYFNWRHWQNTFALEKESPLWLFDQVSLCIDAARQKQGKALAWHRLSQHSLKSSNLAKIGDNTLLLPFSYYLVYAPNSQKRTELERLYPWLVALFD